jgi:hypothetical protein
VGARYPKTRRAEPPGINTFSFRDKSLPPVQDDSVIAQTNWKMVW